MLPVTMLFFESANAVLETRCANADTRPNQRVFVAGIGLEGLALGNVLELDGFELFGVGNEPGLAAV